MPSPEGNTSQESPFFALKPIIVLDVVGVCKQGVQGKEGEGIQVQVPWDCGLEGCPGYFWGANIDVNPRNRLSGMSGEEERGGLHYETDVAAHVSGSSSREERERTYFVW